MMRRLVLLLGVCAACGGPPKLVAPGSSYQSPVTGATIALDRYQRFAHSSFEEILASVKGEGVSVTFMDNLDRAGPGARGLYAPPWDPDTADLPNPELPRILLVKQANAGDGRRILLHEYAHYLLLTARFPEPVVVAGKKCFAGKVDRLTIADSKYSALASPGDQARQGLALLLSALKIHLQGFLSESEAFRLQLDTGKVMLTACDVAEIHAALTQVTDVFELQTGLRSSARSEVTPCAYQRHPLMKKLLGLVKATDIADETAALTAECQRASAAISAVRAHLESVAPAIQAGCPKTQS